MKTHQQKPCSDCPFRTDCLKGWLPNIEEFIETPSFLCHKNTDKQCAGHMLLRKEKNAYYHFAKVCDVDLKLKGKDLVFSNEEECKKHHLNK